MSSSLACSRRHLLLSGAAGAALALLGAPARASLARAISLQALTRGSRHVVVGTPADSYSVWEEVGGRRRIVTYTRLLVEEAIARLDPAPELMVRTLGGRIGDTGQIVHGEAVLAAERPCVLFVGGGDVLVVQGMGQGEYPLVAGSSERRLALSPRLGELESTAGSATVRLNRQPLSEARRRIQGAQ
ncbi:MAG: hypothetical protein KIT72_12910 [Polyangiaceae bacterium]|nr:hypothetical protein [Polyangiaceae bacterium]MCW5791312.1 hypothetical protein [Polyangiaceae bacterium]